MCVSRLSYFLVLEIDFGDWDLRAAVIHGENVIQ